MSLAARLAFRCLLGLMVVGGMMFVPAGTIHFWQGWAFLGAAYVPVIFAFLYFYRHDPKLVERRLQRKEKVAAQRWLVRFLQPAFFAAMLLPGLDHRWGWSRKFLGAEPVWLEVASLAVVLAAILTVAWVFQTNSFASRTIQVEVGQPVISTGPYAVVRHPMYSASIVMFLATPIALGSYVSLPAFALLVPIYVFRLLNEEKVLQAELPGYAEYCSRTRFRLIPLVW